MTDDRRDPEEEPTVAAVDLGSNSFHMVVARWVAGRFHVVDKLRERVRLAAGLDEGRQISDEAAARALACLERFGQRLRDMSPDVVRAVGTNALRRARNARPFLRRAQTALGHEIQVIAGSEEARLIYLGVARHHGDDTGRRLVVDIGGGSTECMVGEGATVLDWDSLYMGCVSWSERFFPGGKITRGRMDEARIAANLELRPIAARLRGLGWSTALGCSGTFIAIDRVLRAADTTADMTAEGVTAKGLKRLRRALRKAGHVDALDLPSVEESRLLVLPGGVAILSAVFDRLKIESMATSGAALREGLLHDLVGRMHQADPRDDTVRHMQTVYRVDRDQAARAERTALALFDAVAAPWGLGASERRLLAWAARVHECGLAIARSGHHRHGAYLLEHSDMPGFAQQDQQTLSRLVLGHRRKLRAPLVEALGPRDLKLCSLLRLAHRLNRSRSDLSVPPVVSAVSSDSLCLEFPDGWLADNPLTHADLGEEASRQEAAGIRLEFA